MAWEAVSKEEVSAIAGVSIAELEDYWYDMSVALIESLAGIYNIGDIQEVTDVMDGSGTTRMRVRKPPIHSIVSVSVSDFPVALANLVFESNYVVLKDGEVDHPYINSQIFPVGDKNIKIVYESGASEDSRVKVGLLLVIKEIIALAKNEGMNTNIQFFRPDRSRVTEQSLIEWGLHGKLVGIIEAIFGRGFKAA